MPGTVTVGCRLPCGIVMYLERLEDFEEQMPTGGVRITKRWVKRTDKPEIRLNGAAHPSQAQRLRGDRAHEIRGGAGLTFNVDADYFAEWASKHPDLTAGDHPLVFAQTKAAEAAAQARDIQAAKTGLEPINPDRLPDEFKGKINTALRT